MDVLLSLTNEQRAIAVGQIQGRRRAARVARHVVAYKRTIQRLVDRFAQIYDDLAVAGSG